MKSNDGVQNLTEYQLSAIVLPFESDDRFDQELVGWFALHLGAWSGTAAELLAAVKTRVDVSNDLWPQSLRALYGRGHHVAPGISTNAIAPVVRTNRKKTSIGYVRDQPHL